MLQPVAETVGNTGHIATGATPDPSQKSDMFLIDFHWKIGSEKMIPREIAIGKKVVIATLSDKF